MRTQDLGELVLLAAIWGASFLFMKLGAGEFGAVAVAALRVAIAALVLLPIVAAQGHWAAMKAQWRLIGFIGVVNSALPFVGFAFAVTVITTGSSSVLNATAPLWGAVVAWAWLGDRPDRWRAIGLAIGFAGVLFLAWDKIGIRYEADAQGVRGGQDAWRIAAAVLACLGATLCYGIAANVTKRKLGGVPPMAVAGGSQLAAAIALAVPAAITWPAQPPGALAWLAVAVLGVSCTGLAYLLYFRLIAHLGAARAIAVTYLIPLFGVAWGVAFLAETVSAAMLIAGVVILLGTALATGFIAPKG